MKPPEAVWADGAAWIDAEAEASRIHDKTHAGRRHGTRLALEPIEAAWLATDGRITLIGTDLAQLLAGHTTETAYLVYCDLRARGLSVSCIDGTLCVWERGTHPPAAPAWTVAPCGEQDPVEAQWLAGSARSGCVAAVVDEDATVTYYRLLSDDPHGSVPPAPLRAQGPLPAQRLADHVLLSDLTPYEAEAIGTPHPAGLMLSAVEAAHLERRGVLTQSVPTTPRLWVQSPVYDDLRARGVVPRSGLRFGADLRAYQGRPDESHAHWLVQCAAPGDVLEWSGLSRGVRLAHSVRKHFLVAVVHEPVEYVRLTWHRP